jgi:hypothetical protein
VPGGQAASPGHSAPAHGLPSSSQTLARRARCFARLGPPHPYLGELAIRTSAPEKASEIHREALAKEIELGAAAEEARALAGLGRSQLAGDSVDAAMKLREALPIYQRIGAPKARLVQGTLDEHGLSAATGHLARRPAIRFQSSSMPTPSVIGPLSRA